MRKIKFKEIEPEATALFKEEIKGCKCFVDVGAEKGYYTKLALDIMSKGKIFAIEPEKNRFEFLKDTIRSVKKDKLEALAIQTCIGEEEGFIKLYSGSTPSVLKNNSKIKKRLLNANNLSKVSTLDNLLKNEKVDFIKIDVEGYELSVLKGAKEILKRCKPKILLEVHPKFLELSDINPEEIYSLLKEYGYEYRLISFFKNEITENLVELYFCC